MKEYKAYTPLWLCWIVKLPKLFLNLCSVTHEGGTLRDLFAWFRYGFRLFWSFFVSCFQRPFSSISCIFNFLKHHPIAKKWQIQWEGVLTNCNQAKSDGKVVSTKAFASSHKKQFIGQFQLILVLMGSLRILTHSNWQLH